VKVKTAGFGEILLFNGIMGYNYAPHFGEGTLLTPYAFSSMIFSAISYSKINKVEKEPIRGRFLSADLQ
jgi:hypothetical protein